MILLTTLLSPNYYPTYYSLYFELKLKKLIEYCQFYHKEAILRFLFYFIKYQLVDLTLLCHYDRLI